MRLATGVVLAFVLVGCPVETRAQAAPPPANVETWGSLSQGRTWRALFLQTVDELRNPDRVSARKAEKHARRLFEEMIEAFVSGSSGTEFIGCSTYLLAVAEYRAGHLDEAAWHWYMAQNFAPSLRTRYQDFQDVAPFMQQNLIPDSWWETQAKRARGEEVGRRAPWHGCERDPAVSPSELVDGPVVTRKVKPSYPKGALEFRRSGPSVIEVQLDRRGVPKAPMVFASCGVPVLDIAAMEAIGQWRYTAAQQAGQPICACLYITVNFELW